MNYKLEEMQLVEIELKNTTFLTVTNDVEKHLAGTEKRFKEELISIKKLGLIRVFHYKED